MLLRVVFNVCSGDGVDLTICHILGGAENFVANARLCETENKTGANGGGVIVRFVRAGFCEIVSTPRLRTD